LNINKSKILHYMNIAFAVYTGILAFLLTWELFDIMTSPESYYPIISEGSTFGCPYQSVTNYRIFSVTGSILMIIAFVSGFFFEDERKSIPARICFIIVSYALIELLSAIMCP